MQFTPKGTLLGCQASITSAMAAFTIPLVLRGIACMIYQNSYLDILIASRARFQEGVVSTRVTSSIHVSGPAACPARRSPQTSEDGQRTHLSSNVSNHAGS